MYGDGCVMQTIRERYVPYIKIHKNRRELMFTAVFIMSYLAEISIHLTVIASRAKVIFTT